MCWEILVSRVLAGSLVQQVNMNLVSRDVREKRELVIYRLKVMVICKLKEKVSFYLERDSRFLGNIFGGFYRVRLL